MKIKDIKKHLEGLLRVDSKYLENSRADNAKLFLEGRTTALKDLLEFIKKDDRK